MRIAAVAIDRRRAAEDHRPVARFEHGRAGLGFAGIKRERLARHARFGERGEDAVRRPRLLRTGLEHQAHLQRNHRQPQRVHARRIRRQHRREHRRLGLVAHRHAAAFFAVAAAEDFEIEPAREAVENLLHVLEHERILRHVGPAHVLGQAGAGRLLMHEIVRRLRAVAHRQRAVLVQIGRLAEHRDQLAAGELLQHVAGLLRLPHVALDDPAAGLADLGNRLARGEVIHLGDFERLVRLAPADDGKFDHGTYS